VLHRADVCTTSKLEAAVATVAARVRKYSELLDMCQSIDARCSQLAKRVKSLREFQEHPFADGRPLDDDCNELPERGESSTRIGEEESAESDVANRQRD
jgi:hypothetical protein